MASKRVRALRAEVEAVSSFCATLGPDEWLAPSRCEGWRVQDVVAHMGAAFHGTFTPWVVKLMRTNDLEGGNDRDAEKRHDWAPEKVFKEYKGWSKRFLRVQPPLQKPPLGALPIRLGEFGNYPAKLLSAALTFDHHLHLRHDIATAVGREAPPTDAERMEVALEWMFAGLGPMSASALDWLDAPITIALDGPGGGTWGVAPPNGKYASVTSGPATSPAATVRSTPEAFTVWATRREPWREADVRVEGNEEIAAKFLDTMRVV